MDTHGDSAELELELRVKALEKAIKRLRNSDRRQQKKMASQQRWSMAFAGVVAVGVVFFTNGLSPENRASLENIFTGAAVMLMGGVGVVGATSSRFKPPGHENEPDDEDEGEDDEA